MIPLIDNDSALTNSLSVRTPSNQATVMKVVNTGHAQGTLVGNTMASASDKPNAAEQAPGTVRSAEYCNSNSTDTGVGSVRFTYSVRKLEQRRCTQR